MFTKLYTELLLIIKKNEQKHISLKLSFLSFSVYIENKSIMGH